LNIAKKLEKVYSIHMQTNDGLILIVQAVLLLQCGQIDTQTKVQTQPYRRHYRRRRWNCLVSAASLKISRNLSISFVAKSVPMGLRRLSEKSTKLCSVSARKRKLISCQSLVGIRRRETAGPVYSSYVFTSSGYNYCTANKRRLISH